MRKGRKTPRSRQPCRQGPGSERKNAQHTAPAQASLPNAAGAHRGMVGNSDTVTEAARAGTGQQIAPPQRPEPKPAPALPEVPRQDEARAKWKTAQESLKQKTDPHSYETWLRPVEALGFTDNGVLVLRAPSPNHLRHLKKKYRGLVEEVVEPQVEFWCEPETQKPTTAETAPKPEKCPVLPEGAWYGLSQQYRQIVGPGTEASHNYHLACFLSALGACLGRSVYIEKAGRHYPNLYVVLMGLSGGARKGTAMDRGLELAQAIDPDLPILRTIDSREGFIENLADIGKEKEKAGSIRAVVRLPELRTLIDKTRTEGLGNIVPMLCDAYDCPLVLQVRTRKNPVSVSNPTVSLIAATTRRWIEGLREADLEGGLGNRIMWIPGEPGEAIPNPPARDQQRWKALVRELRKAVRHWQKKGSTAFSISSGAAAHWERIYAELYAHRREDPLIAVLSERLQNHCLKAGLIFAALDGTAVIELRHLVAAHAFTQFLYDGLWHLFRGFGMSPMAQLDAKIVEAVKQAGLGGIRLPRLKHRFWRTDAETLNRRLYHLTQTDGPLKRVTDGQRVIIVPGDL